MHMDAYKGNKALLSWKLQEHRDPQNYLNVNYRIINSPVWENVHIDAHDTDYVSE